VPPPPDAASTRNEISWLKGVAAEAKTDARIPPQIAFWDAGAPSYRWVDLIWNRIQNGQPLPIPHRVFTYVNMAMYDATVAAWESKYFYNRQRPSEVDPTVPTALPVRTNGTVT
jgi:hypothetical protein